jgi:hypothetical protein
MFVQILEFRSGEVLPDPEVYLDGLAAFDLGKGEVLFYNTRRDGETFIVNFNGEKLELAPGQTTQRRVKAGEYKIRCIHYSFGPWFHFYLFRKYVIALYKKKWCKKGYYHGKIKVKAD